VCVTGEDAGSCKGGETRVELSPGHEVVSRATTTPGGGLLFRKDLVHEGLPVLEGRKEIVTLDLWATRRDSESILVVTFPQEDRAAASGDNSSEDEAVGPLQVCGHDRERP
jgi:hypothetical protein